MRKFLAGFLLAALVFGGGAIIAGDITSTGMGQGDLYTYLSNVKTIVNSIKSSLNAADITSSEAKLRCNLISASLQISADNTSRFNAGAIEYMIGGALYAAAADNNVAPTACTAQAASKYRLYLITINAAGAYTVTAGTEAATDTATLPAIPAAGAPVGAIKIQTGAGGTFTMATDALTGGNVAAATYFDFVGPIYNTEYTFTQTTVSESDLALTGL